MTATNGPAKERLAFFLPGLYDGGVERVMVNLAKGIVERGYSLDLVLGRAEGPFLDQVPDSVRIIDLKAPRVLVSTPALVRYLRSERPAALLSVLYANIMAVWAKCLAGTQTRTILAEHNTLSSVAGGEKDLRLNIFPLLARWFYPWCDGIIAVSKGVAADLERTINIRHERVSVIYNPIITAEMLAKSKAGLEHPWFEAAQPPVLVATGRLTAQKGFDILIRSFSLLKKDRQVRLLILGEGEERAALERLVRELNLENDVTLPGFVANPYPFMARAAVFVLSSRWEGLPTVLVEAMALGAPVVATNCPSGPCEILNGGQLGQLVPVEDPQALAAAITACLDHKKVSLPPDCLAPFALDTVVDQYIQILLGH